MSRRRRGSGRDARGASAPARPREGGPPRDAGRARSGGPPLDPASAADRWRVAALAAAAITGLALAWFAFTRHPVGDYFDESDFYGGYAAGARLIQHGRLDFARYSVVGPVYELVLAALGAVAGDLFTAARLISILAATAALAAWASILARLRPGAAALGAVVLMAANAHFFEYGYSATTEMLALALQAGCVWALLSPWGAAAPLLAGALAALATLTRYSGIVLVPAALLTLGWLAPTPGMTRRRALALFAVGFLVPVLAWTVPSALAGHLPGEQLVRGFAFYSNPSVSRNVQDVVGGLADTSGTYGAGPAGAAQALNPARLALALVDHMKRYARDLMGVPVAIAALLGLALLVWERRLRAWAPLLLPAALTVIALLPVFYSNRYSLVLVPAFALLAASPLGGATLTRLPRALRVVLPATLLGVLALVSGRASAIQQQYAATQLPREVLAMGRGLRAIAPPGSRVIARKGHIGFYSGLDVEPMPRVRTLSELAEECRARHVQFIYFSWYEAELRPEFWHLLDTTGVVPGLTVACATDSNPAVVYRIGAAFGRDPDWFASDTLKLVHTARARVRVLPDEMAWADNWFLAGWDVRHGDLDRAVTELEATLRARPGMVEARQAMAYVLHQRRAAQAPAPH